MYGLTLGYTSQLQVIYKKVETRSPLTTHSHDLANPNTTVLGKDFDALERKETLHL